MEPDLLRTTALLVKFAASAVAGKPVELWPSLVVSRNIAVVVVVCGIRPVIICHRHRNGDDGRLTHRQYRRTWPEFWPADNLQQFATWCDEKTRFAAGGSVGSVRASVWHAGVGPDYSPIRRPIAAAAAVAARGSDASDSGRNDAGGISCSNQVKSDIHHSCTFSPRL